MPKAIVWADVARQFAPINSVSANPIKLPMLPCEKRIAVNLGKKKDLAGRRFTCMCLLNVGRCRLFRFCGLRVFFFFAACVDFEDACGVGYSSFFFLVFLPRRVTLNL